MVEANPHDQLYKYTAQTQGINATSQLYRLSQSLHMNVEQKHLAVERFEKAIMNTAPIVSSLVQCWRCAIATLIDNIAF